MAQRVIDRDFYLHIRERMVKKDPNIAAAFEMSVLGELSAKEIAKALGVPERKVYYLIQQAKQIGKDYDRLHG